MIKNTLILHGWGATSESNFFPWLKKNLEFKADEVFVPNLPSTSFPVLEEQLEYLLAYSSDFYEGGNIIGHSLGGQLTLHFVTENNIENSNIILVAPSYNNVMKDTGEDIFGGSKNILKSYFNSEIDFEKFNKLNNKVTIFLSKNDELINLESAKNFYSQIENVEFKIFDDKGHFTVFELEEILDYLK